MAQDPDREEDEQNQDDVLTSHALDMVPVYESSNVDAEMEGDVIRGLLDSNGIPSLLIRPGPFPLRFQVLVPRGKMVEARRLIDDAQAGGAEAADAAEAESEKPQ
jgi:hypothetical protein